jgi:hypothetical protein
MVDFLFNERGSLIQDNVTTISTLIEAIRLSIHAADESPIFLMWLMNEGRIDFTGHHSGILALRHLL